MIYKQPSIYRIGGAGGNENFNDLEIEILDSNIVSTIEYFEAKKSDNNILIAPWLFINASNMSDGWNNDLVKIKNVNLLISCQGAAFWSDGAGNTLNKFTQYNFANSGNDIILSIIKPAEVYGNTICYSNSIYFPR